MEQVKDQRYIEKFKQGGVASVLAIGLSFCGKAVELVHESIIFNLTDFMKTTININSKKKKKSIRQINGLKINALTKVARCETMI